MKSNGKGRKMSREEALQKMSAVAAGFTLMNGALNIMETKHANRGLEKILKNPVLAKAVSELEYLTPADKFIVQRRGNPVLTEIPHEKLASIGLTPETWKLEIVADSESNSEIGNPMTLEKGNAFTWGDLMNIAEKHSVKYLHALTCTNSPKLYGMGLWEGVPLRDILWKTNPKQNIRRAFFHGFHNNDEKQIFRASLHISRILEEAPEELPVILAYKLNGKAISHANGGPVRLFVPGYYSNRSIKWLQNITLTNSFQANDTYAEANNDVEGPIKTCARFIKAPGEVKTGESFAITGFAQVGISGLGKVQFLILPSGKLSDEDPYLSHSDWQDALILPPPAKWGSDLPDGKLPDILQTDPKTGNPLRWPLINTIVHWACVTRIDTAGDFEIRCRTIDSNGIAQPMPRQFGRSGYNRIEVVKIRSEKV
jgi:DMSO/TMAO reductase YedYZ molybdopterin-dependent catalytic subunit